MTDKTQSKFVVTPQIVEGKLQVLCQNTGVRSMTRTVLAYNNRALQASKQMTLKPGVSDTLDASHLFGSVIIQVSVRNGAQTMKTVTAVSVPQIYEFSVSEIARSTDGYLAILVTNHTMVAADLQQAEFRLEGANPPMGSRFPYFEADSVTFIDFLKRAPGPVEVWIGGKKIANREIHESDYSIYGYFNHLNEYVVSIKRTGSDMTVPVYLTVAAYPDPRQMGAPYELIHLANGRKAEFIIPFATVGKLIKVVIAGQLEALFKVETRDVSF